uniref:Secreted protein n=1 Tax=Physcomitrium patens TaxID=3218 RepID=A0A2K1KWA0_PHYPA|nr:hypothetical protein PHYPA_005057 [Physcomitrium patens]
MRARLPRSHSPTLTTQLTAQVLLLSSAAACVVNCNATTQIESTVKPHPGCSTNSLTRTQAGTQASRRCPEGLNLCSSVILVIAPTRICLGKWYLQQNSVEITVSQPMLLYSSCVQQVAPPAIDRYRDGKYL